MFPISPTPEEREALERLRQMHQEDQETCKWCKRPHYGHSVGMWEYCQGQHSRRLALARAFSKPDYGLPALDEIAMFIKASTESNMTLEDFNKARKTEPPLKGYEGKPMLKPGQNK